VNGHRTIVVATACLGLVLGCTRSREESDTSAAAGRTGNASTAPASQPAATGTLKVLGEGTGLYRVFGASDDKPLVTGSSGNAVALPAGTYTVVLNKMRQRVDVTAGRETVLATGRLEVAGLEKDLYEVWDEAGKTKLNFKYTGREMTLFDGTYQVRINNSTQAVTVRPGEKTVVQAGSVVVGGEAKGLYEVWDEAGKAKLGFTSVGKPMELLPGTYTVIHNGRKHTAVVKPKERATVKP